MHVQTSGAVQVPPFWHGNEQIADTKRRTYYSTRSISYMSHLRTSHTVPFQPESQMHMFGLVQLPLTHDGEQIAKNMNIQQRYD